MLQNATTSSPYHLMKLLISNPYGVYAFVYLFSTIVKREKNRKSSEFATLISLGITLGHTTLLTVDAIGRCINKAAIPIPLIVL